MLQRICTVLLFFSFLISNAQNKGKIAGKIEDAGNSEELIGVAVGVKGSSAGAMSDIEGHYSLSLDSGTYTILVSYTGYRTKEITDVQVKSGEVTYLNVTLEEAVTELDEVVITTTVRKETEANVIADIKNATTVSSGVSAELIRRMPDRTTADVVKRISGASIQDGKFAVIRGLSDRYNMGIMNGIPLPSTEPDRKAFSLDFIPAALIDNMTISKTASADMPGDFAGGLINIRTKDITDENTFFISLSGGVHSITTFKQFNRTPVKSGTDWLGYDNGSRKLPAGLPSPEEMEATERFSSSDPVKLAASSGQFNHSYAPRQVSSIRPNYGIQLGLTRNFNIRASKLGIVFIASNSSNFRYEPYLSENPDLSKTDGKVQRTVNGTQYNFDRYTSQANSAAILNIGFKLNDNHKFVFKNLVNFSGTDQSITRNGSLVRDDSAGVLKLNDVSSYYQTSRIYLGQFGGEHVISKHKLVFKYLGGVTNINRVVPDFKRISYVSERAAVIGTDDNGDPVEKGFEYKPYTANVLKDPTTFDPTAAGKFFSKMNENTYNFSADLKIPFHLLIKNELKIGAFYQNRDRDFAARTFMYGTDANKAPLSKIGAWKLSPIDQLFAADRFDADGSGFFLKEVTQVSDKYKANSTINAYYFMFDNRITTKLRALWGLRVEKWTQKIESGIAGSTTTFDTTNIDPLPSANVVYSFNDQHQLRAAYARTLSRPEFRETAPFLFYDFALNANVSGTLGLKRATVQNFDLKYEFYAAPGSVLAINPFYKQFYDQIESEINPGGTIRNFGFQNAQSATNYGIEIEARIKLTALDSLFNTRFLNNVVLFSNLALIKSEVKLQTISQYNADKGITEELEDPSNGRPLQGQSPYVFNAGAQYSVPKKNLDLTATYNVIGRRIAFVAPAAYQFIWENPRHVIDLSISKRFTRYFSGKFTVGDLLSQDLILYQDINENNKYEAGDVNAYRYKMGKSYTLTLSLNF